MRPAFDSFILLAEMRTGSNYLEANLNAIDGVRCYGEAFNPHFLGYPKQGHLFAMTLAQREADPIALIVRMKAETDGLPGFRFFHDHDPRVFEHCLADRRCAKVVLTRNPLESYVSLKIARGTGQWKLSDARHQKTTRIRFEAAEFTAHVEALHGFQLQLLRALQGSGQTAFYLDYDDVQDIAVINGLARFLGVEGRLTTLADGMVRQNPEPLSEKVSNFAEMEAALAGLDRFNLTRTPNFEPRRGPSVPGFRRAAVAPLLHMPMRGGPVAQVDAWLAALDGAPAIGGFTQKSLRQWKRQTPGHRSFTVLRHPVARAHAAFCTHILSGDFAEIRAALIDRYKLSLPEPGAGAGYGLVAHRQAFLGFLGFLKANLAGQTSLRTDVSWTSQAAILQAFAQVQQPDMVLREAELTTGLAALAASVGRQSPAVPIESDDHTERLAGIYDDEIEAATRDACHRDYMMFGFGRWRG